MCNFKINFPKNDYVLGKNDFGYFIYTETELINLKSKSYESAIKEARLIKKKTHPEWT